MKYGIITKYGCRLMEDSCYSCNKAKDCPGSEDVYAVAFDKNTGYIKTVISCSRKDAFHYTEEYRKSGYNSKVLTYEELEKIEEQDEIERYRYS